MGLNWLTACVCVFRGAGYVVTNCVSWSSTSLNKFTIFCSEAACTIFSWGRCCIICCWRLIIKCCRAPNISSPDTFVTTESTCINWSRPNHCWKRRKTMCCYRSNKKSYNLSGRFHNLITSEKLIIINSIKFILKYNI